MLAQQILLTAGLAMNLLYIPMEMGFIRNAEIYKQKGHPIEYRTIEGSEGIIELRAALGR